MYRRFEAEVEVEAGVECGALTVGRWGNGEVETGARAVADAIVAAHDAPP